MLPRGLPKAFAVRKRCFNVKTALFAGWVVFVLVLALSKSRTRQRAGSFFDGGLKFHTPRASLIGEWHQCDNSCPTARDGVCGEGRPAEGENPVAFGLQRVNVTCDLGTDCADCGPWHFYGRTDWARDWRPVADLRARNVTLVTRRVGQPQPYLFGYTDSSIDVDVSGQMDYRGATFEPQLNRFWYEILENRCAFATDADAQSLKGAELSKQMHRGHLEPSQQSLRDRSAHRRLVLDVGANFGYYTLLAASLGCRVVAWEPVPLFAAFMRWGLLVNNLTDNVEVRDAILSDTHGGELEIVVPTTGIWGTAGVGGNNLDKNSPDFAKYERVRRATERVDRVVKLAYDESVALLKVDVEGFEPQVLRGCRDLLLADRVDHIIMEYSPGVATNNGDFKGGEMNAAMLLGLAQEGFSLYDMPWKLPFLGWTAPLPPLEEIRAASLVYDASDMILAQEGRMGCPPEGLEPEMSKRMYACNTVPWACHPFSYFANFRHNTNVWAARTRPPVKLLRDALVPGVDMATDLAHRYEVFKDTSVGLVRCGHIKAKDLPRNRCPCTHEDCRDVESALRQLGAKGLLEPAFVQPPLEQYRIYNW